MPDGSSRCWRRLFRTRTTGGWRRRIFAVPGRRAGPGTHTVTCGRGCARERRGGNHRRIEEAGYVFAAAAAKPEIGCGVEPCGAGIDAAPDGGRSRDAQTVPVRADAIRSSGASAPVHVPVCSWAFTLFRWCGGGAAFAAIACCSRRRTCSPRLASRCLLSRPDPLRDSLLFVRYAEGSRRRPGADGGARRSSTSARPRFVDAQLPSARRARCRCRCC